MKRIKRKVHFVGVGGIGMSGLAEILLNLGYETSGSDLQPTVITDRLAQCGLRFHEGHDASHVGDAEIVVVSEAVPHDNAEVQAARERGTPVLHRSELLADLMRLKPNAIAVGGTHGKTTTTSMISAMFERANFGATSIVGGILHRSGTNARWGTGEYLVAEADEHDGSFLRLHPTISVVTSIDAEHLEYYGTLDRIKRAFVDFCNVVPFYGYSILCWDDPNARDILGEIDSVCLTYGLERGASLRGANVRWSEGHSHAPMSRRLAELRTSIDVISEDERLGVTGELGALEVKSLGVHNVRNALAACCVGLCLGLKFPHIADGLRMYDGVRRRLQVCGEERGVLVVEDYAHHPTEIESTLEAARWIRPN
ncbi:MAG TPA: UDP-N-acetylmuramate--L-alanine ligase, partial [Candidatus Hydrogenedentes bacterium]|nr:UDP-N-acetylmuramate--L-alanine ligase [Candidatus Hydrogenedentota bacterium]